MFNLFVLFSIAFLVSAKNNKYSITTFRLFSEAELCENADRKIWHSFSDTMLASIWLYNDFPCVPVMMKTMLPYYHRYYNYDKTANTVMGTMHGTDPTCQADPVGGEFTFPVGVCTEQEHGIHNVFTKKSHLLANNVFTSFYQNVEGEEACSNDLISGGGHIIEKNICVMYGAENDKSYKIVPKKKWGKGRKFNVELFTDSECQIASEEEFNGCLDLENGYSIKFLDNPLTKKVTKHFNF